MYPDFSRFTKESREILGTSLWDHLCVQYHERNLNPDDVILMLERAYKTGYQHCQKDYYNGI